MKPLARMLLKPAKVLDITLTKRGAGSTSEIELAGFPHHSLDTYLPKLVRAGHRVAICDQLEDPRFVKGIVKRGVTELVTPGVPTTTMCSNGRGIIFLPPCLRSRTLSALGFSTSALAKFYCAQEPANYIFKLIQSLSPSEIIFCKGQREKFENHFGEEYATFTLDDWVYAFDFAREKLIGQFKTSTLKGFGIDGLNEAIIAAGAIFTTWKQRNTGTPITLPPFPELMKRHTSGSINSPFAILSLSIRRMKEVYPCCKYWIKPSLRWARASCESGWSFH